MRKDGRSRAAGIVRNWRNERGSRHVLLLPWTRRIGVGVRVGTFKGERVTIATADFSAARPRPRSRGRRRSSRSPRLGPRRRRSRPRPLPPPAPPPPSGPVVGVPYTCNGPVNGVRVVGTGSDPRALVNLAAGCTGTLSFDIHVTSGGGDGVKVQPGVHDLTIGPSRIVCDRLDRHLVPPGRRAGAGRLERDLQRAEHRLPVCDRAGRGRVLHRRQGLQRDQQRRLRRLQPRAPALRRDVHGAGARQRRAQLDHPPGRADRRLLREAGRSRRGGGHQQHARAATATARACPADPPVSDRWTAESRAGRDTVGAWPFSTCRSGSAGNGCSARCRRWTRRIPRHVPRGRDPRLGRGRVAAIGSDVGGRERFRGTRGRVR